MVGVVAAYQRDPDMAPDEMFESGRLAHLVAGNSCRLLDARRTPLRVLAVRPDVGFFDVEVLAFEDRGATWELPLEWVERLQFPLDGAIALPPAVGQLDEALRRFDHRLDLDVDSAAREATMDRLVEERAQADDWLDSPASPWGSTSRHLDPDAPSGDPLLIADLDAYLDGRGLGDLERGFATGYVSNPSSGDLVKAHAIVAAELGLAPYHGPILRDPDALRGEVAADRRAAHLLARLGYVSTAFRAAGHDQVVVHRGMSFEHGVDWRPTATFVSTTFSLDIATSQSALGPNRTAGVLMHQRVSVDRLLMTHLETGAMNDRFHEAEAVLLADPTALF